ncbi:zinc ribbon domain-containing protein [Solibaculum mannosilyticum]|uniref:HTH cro/C1-type domain-containing protein n=1 Tax=Solibaculum mannosilyticum TaxID=2780922 RepID=A0A7I8D3A9_9FIRM|nr:zinc ribbon domain-containing protein [Solibaculum mannosilyticum]BCI61306.1 hypothetical protein C12CBH8_19450 [Solibaculum mannosilyticum]
METKNVLFGLRKQHNLTQDEMAHRLLVTRQAVSRWETGETIPSVDTLKLISREFNISVNTLLGTPSQLICQSCGMPMEDDSLISREANGDMNEQYCKWCYADGDFLSHCTMEEMVEQCIPHMGWEDERQARQYLQNKLKSLSRWKQEE